MKQCENCNTEIISKWSSTSKGGKYCSIVCQQAKQHKDYITRWKEGLENGRKGLVQTSGHIRKYLFEKYNSQCARCGWGAVNPVTGKTPLEINHINGDWKDNTETNLELICPNCHSLEPTFRALNKGKGRYSTPGIFNPGNGKTKA